ncbi:histidine kinase [Mucilaginibacter sp. CAU 1740]|uniref:sensor histidine kinase n=1 Tax=Mucilaginibacter sp. CAU 1740 TaxID=3140365 RepID=UPI00325BF9FD
MKAIPAKTIRNHLICWVLFITYEVLVSYSFSKKLSNFFDYSGHYLINILLFYFNTYVILTRDSRRSTKGKLLITIIYVLLEIGGYIIVKYLLYELLLYFQIYKNRQGLFGYFFIAESIWRAIYFIGLSTGYWYFMSALKQRAEISKLIEQRLLEKIEFEELERKLVETENSFLKAQINPHFFFNVLGFIHNQVKKHSGQAAETVVLLADIMRYALKKPEEDGKTPIEKEIEHIENYIEINRLRFDHKINIEFVHQGELSGVKIIPLLLITIVENVFKYGDLADPKFPAMITLSSEDGNILFRVSNKKNYAKYQFSHGIGMDNVRKRLSQSYPDTFELNVDDNAREYTLTLSIKSQ